RSKKVASHQGNRRPWRDLLAEEALALGYPRGQCRTGVTGGSMDVRHDDETIHEALRQTPYGPRHGNTEARVPYWVYQDEANRKREQQRVFEGATWNFVCLEDDIPNKGDYRTNHVGTMPVIVVRGPEGEINCFENRCAHRGSLIAFDDGGNVQNNFKC